MLLLLLGSTPAMGPGEPAPANEPFEIGYASWYGDPFHGRETASGEVYDMHQFTAAHPSLAFGSTVRVTDVGTGRSVVVRINDRGPYLGQRILDLSYAAARQLRLVRPGSAEVRLDLIGEYPTIASMFPRWPPRQTRAPEARTSMVMPAD